MTEARQTRAYHSPVRENRARRTRLRVLEAAADRFSAHGFAGTTLAAIAADAEVSIDSVVAVGSKGALLLECFRLRYAGAAGWRSIFDDPDINDMLSITDREAGLDAAVDFLTAGHARSAGLWFVVRSTAPFDPVVAAGLAELIELKQASFAVTVDWLAGIGVLEPPSTPEERRSLATHVNVVMSAETYVVMTHDWGLSSDDYAQWLREVLPRVRP